MWTLFNQLRNTKGQMAIAPVLMTAVALGVLFQMRNIKLNAYQKEEVSNEEEVLAAILLDSAQVTIEQSFRSENSHLVQGKLFGCPIHPTKKCFTICDPRRQAEKHLILKNRSGSMVLNFPDSLGANSCSEESLFHAAVHIGTGDDLEKNEMELVLEIPSRSELGKTRKISRFIRYETPGGTE